MIGDFLRAGPRRPERPALLPDAGPPPAFCPRCRAPGATDDRLCGECGESLVPSGYCATCEAAWNRPIGDPCPKHDLPLEPAPPPPGPFVGPGDDPVETWVTVATYGHPNEANAARIRLEAEGVRTFLDGERVAGSTLFQVATGGARLQVPESLAGAARVLLAQTWSARLDPDSANPTNDEDDDDPWAGLAPVPGARRRAIMKLAIVLFLCGPTLITLLAACAHALGWAD